MSNQLNPVQEEVDYERNQFMKGLTETQYNSQNYYEIKKSNQEISPQKKEIQSRLGDISSTISQFSPCKSPNKFMKQSKQSFSPNRTQLVRQSLSPQKNQINSFDKSQLESNLYGRNQQQQMSNPFQIVTSQARRIEELQIQVELLKQREFIQLSAEEQNQLISDLYTQVEQKNTLLQRQNEIISSLERQTLDANARLRIFEIDTEQNMIEIKQYKDELMLQNARNQSLQQSLNELRKAFEELQNEKMQMGDNFRKQYSDALEENLSLKNKINEIELKNNQMANELNTALDQIISEKAQQELLKKQMYQEKQQQVEKQPFRKISCDDENQIYNNLSPSYNNQSFLLDDFHANTINISMTSENLSEKMKKYCAELDIFIEKFLENKKYRVRSKQEMKFFTEMGKMISFLKNKHLKMSDEFKEQVEIMNKKSEETRFNMITTLAHVRILKQSTEITITDLEKTIDDLKSTKEKNFKKIEEQSKKIQNLENEIVELKKKNNQQTVKIHELTELSNQRQTNIEQLEKNINNLNQNITDLLDQQSKINEQFKQREQQMQQNINEQGNQINHLQNKQEQLLADIQELTSKLNDQKLKVDDLKQDIKDLHEQMDTEKEEYEQIIKQNIQSIESKNQQIKQQLEQIEELTSQVQILGDNGDNQGQEVIRLNQEVKELKQSEYNLQEDVRTCKRKIMSLENKLSNNFDDRQQLVEQNQQLQEENLKLASELDELKLSKNEIDIQYQHLHEQTQTSELELSVIKDKIPLVEEEMKQLIELKDKNLLQINQLKAVAIQQESKLLVQETKIKELEDELEQKQVLVQMMKVELEQIDSLHQESMIHEKVYYVKKQEEYEKTIFNLIEENKQLKLQKETLNTSINYLNKLDNFFDNENQVYQDQKQQIQKQNKKVKVLVQELDNQMKEKQILEKRISELETYINLIIENSIEYNVNNDKQIQELKQVLFNSQKENINVAQQQYYLGKNDIQTYNINLQSPENKANEDLSMQVNNPISYESNEII
ncbi:hypothetical protein ABPG72_012913 [Tetrahymena utriculariae]